MFTAEDIVENRQTGWMPFSLRVERASPEGVLFGPSVDKREISARLDSLEIRFLGEIEANGSVIVFRFFNRSRALDFIEKLNVLSDRQAKQSVITQ